MRYGFVLTLVITLLFPTVAEAPPPLKTPALPKVVVGGDSRQIDEWYEIRRLAARLIEMGAPADEATEWVRYFMEYGEDAGVDPVTLMAMSALESEFNPRAYNPADPSYGLMAVMPRYWRNSFVRECGERATPETLRDPRVGICYGAYIAAHFARQHRDEIRKITAYNNGSGQPNGYARVVLRYRKSLAGV